MSFTAGTKLGPYEIVVPLGAGGMGEVYKARDTRLDRVVAIKVLSATLLGDPEFRERFEREARTISQLTHPHICVLHDIGRYEQTDYLVMEFLDGETLSARIDKGPLKLDEALRIAVQIARALDAAHRAGIVHRDLKPSNVMLTKTGAKLLDFGLAKQSAGVAGRLGVGPESARLQASLRDLTSPLTVNSPLTMRGSIVGTLQYMAPEQLEGGDADARSDMFAFGAVLYEMVSGKKAFSGKSQVSVMAAILEHDPPSLIVLQPSLPAALDRLIRKCLAKDPEARWQNAGDVASELEWIGETVAQPASAGAIVGAEGVATARRRARAWIAAAVILPVVAAAATWAAVHAPAAERPAPVRFAIARGGTQRLSAGSGQRDLAISPDGTHVAYTLGSTAANSELWVRAFDRLDAVQLQGLNSPQNPFFSPDSKWIAFGSLGELKKISVNGGPPISLCRIRGVPRGATWSADTIVFGTSDPAVGLFSVPAGGGEPKVLTTPDPKSNETGHMFPSLLPGGNAVLFTITTTGVDNAQVAVLDLKSGQRKILIRGGSQAEYVSTGHLVYAAGGSVRAVRFDPLRLEVLSDPIPVVEQVMMKASGAAQFSVSQGGALAYVTGGASGQAAAPRSLVWVDRLGREEPIKAPLRGYFVPRLSPDGTQVALDIRDQEHDIWTWDFAHETLTRITKDPNEDILPVWTTDGRHILFGSARDGIQNLYWQAADGTGAAERLSTSANVQIPLSASPDGTEVIVREAQPSGLAPFMLLMHLDGKRTMEPLIHTAFRDDNGVISPDGHWIAYESDESGLHQIYVRPFPDVSTGLKQISSSGGSAPLWARDGRELFYLDGGAAHLMTVPVRTSPAFTYGTPTKLFDVPYLTSASRTYDVSRDGKKFLFIKDAPVGDQGSLAPSSSIVVVLNWFEDLKARVPTK